MQVLAAAEYLSVTDTDFFSLRYDKLYVDFGIVPRVYFYVDY